MDQGQSEGPLPARVKGGQVSNEERSSEPESEDWVVHIRPGIQLPLRESPIKFAVTMPDGRTSNAWRVWTERREAYVCCRDTMKETKISLHRSGKQHIAFRQETGLEMTSGSRFWDQWHEPPQQSPVIPSFQLVFPSWGARLTEAARRKARKRWDDNQILLEGDDELMVVVSFVIMDASRNLKYDGKHPHVTIGVLPFGDGKNLFVVAGKGPEGNFRDLVQRRLSKMALNDTEIVSGVLAAQARKDAPMACLTGENPEGGRYMVVVPVEVRSVRLKGNGPKPGGEEPARKPQGPGDAGESTAGHL